MKIDLKLTNESLAIITATLAAVYKTKAQNRRHKSTLSIAIDTVSKLDSKCANVKVKMDLFNAKTKTKITLKYHEADMLELLLIQEIAKVDDNYIRLKIQNVIDDLNQKLA